MKTNEIIIIGGGITGLVAAIKLSELYKVPIKIYEKRLFRTRNQIIVLNPSSLIELPKSIQNSKLFGFVQPVESDQSGQTWPSSHAGQMCIRICELEMLLLDLISKIPSIDWMHQKLEKSAIQEMINSSQNTLFIGADGYQSPTRQVLEIPVIQHTITYGLVCTFQGSTNRSDISDIRQRCGVNMKNILGITQHRYRGFRTKSSWNQISIQLTSDENTDISQSKILTAADLPKSILALLESGAKFYGMILPII